MSRTVLHRVLFPMFAVMLMFLSVMNSGGAHVYAQSSPQETIAAVPNDPSPPKHSGKEQSLLEKKIAAADAFALQPKSVSRYCVATPSGGCAYPVSVGGQYVEEPADEFNWCGPGAGTAAFLHWNSNAVNNHNPITVTNNSDGDV